jgi:chemotaxis response regulator CheB
MTQPAQNPIRILLVDDHQSLLWGLAKLIESEKPGMEVVGVAAEMSEALVVAQREQPDVILLDIDLGGVNSLDLLPDLLKAVQAYVLILTGVRDTETHDRAMLSGARGILHKEDRQRSSSRLSGMSPEVKSGSTGERRGGSSANFSTPGMTKPHPTRPGSPPSRRGNVKSSMSSSTRSARQISRSLIKWGSANTLCAITSRRSIASLRLITVSNWSCIRSNMASISQPHEMR